jgi:hypothetical protein
MAKAHFGLRDATHVPRGDWRKAISDNVAYALLIYTMDAIKTLAQGSILPYLSLIVLVAAIIPACRKLEKRWEDLDDAHATDPALRPLYRRDQVLLWLLAIGLPFVLTGLITAFERLT